LIEKKYEDMVRPVKAYVTFTSQEAAMRAVASFGTGLNGLQ